MNGWARIAICRNTSAVTNSTVPCRAGSVFASAHGAAREIAVGIGDHRPDRAEHLVELLRRHRFAGLTDHASAAARMGCRPALKAPGRQRTAEVARHHGERPLGEVAEIVGEIGVDAVDDRVVAVVAVLPERHFAQEEIAQRIAP